MPKKIIKKQTKKPQKKLKPKVIFEAEDYVVIDKPAGMVVHADGKTDMYTVSDWAVEQYPEITKVGEAIEIDGEEVPRAGIVHRLDKETSGVLIIVRTDRGYNYFKKLFKNKTIQKVYRAYVYGKCNRPSFIVNVPIQRSEFDFRRRVAGIEGRGDAREAQTAVRVITSGVDLKNDKSKHEFSYVEARPLTGRTHQIRVHMKSVGHPVVSDSLYAAKRAKALGFTRLALHAHSISFKDPAGVARVFEAPFPADFIEAERRLGPMQGLID